MNCPACGHALKNPGVSFCSKCGAKIDREALLAATSPPPPVELAPAAPTPEYAPPPHQRLPRPPTLPELALEQGVGRPVAGADRLTAARVWRCRERVLTLRDRYDVKDEQGNPIFKVEGRFIQFFPRVNLFLPDRPGEPWLTVAWRWMGFKSLFMSHYALTQADGGVVAIFRKNMFLDAFFSRWHLLDESGAEFGVAEEESLIKAITNRFVAKMFRSNFNIFFEGAPAARYVRNWTLFDSYTMQQTPGADLAPHHAASLAALVVVLDKGQRR